MPPAHILNAPTKLMKQLGYGAGYEYDHGAEEAFSGQNYFPDDMDRVSSTAADRGFEREIGRRLEHWAGLRDKRSGNLTIRAAASAIVSWPGYGPIAVRISEGGRGI